MELVITKSKTTVHLIWTVKRLQNFNMDYYKSNITKVNLQVFHDNQKTATVIPRITQWDICLQLYREQKRHHISKIDSSSQMCPNLFNWTTITTIIENPTIERTYKKPRWNFVPSGNWELTIHSLLLKIMLSARCSHPHPCHNIPSYEHKKNSIGINWDLSMIKIS